MNNTSEGYCGQCGAVNPFASKFCYKCGATLPWVQVETSLQPPQAEQVPMREDFHINQNASRQTAAPTQNPMVSHVSPPPPTAAKSNPSKRSIFQAELWQKVLLGFLGFILIVFIVGASVGGSKEAQGGIFWTTVTIILVVYIIGKINEKQDERERLARMTPDEKQSYLNEKQEQKQRLLAEQQTQRAAAMKNMQESAARNQYGALNTSMMCPHCHTKGKVRTKPITQKKGVSGSKAAAAVVTGGLSVLAVGLARKEKSTQAHCGNCNNTWLF